MSMFKQAPVSMINFSQYSIKRTLAEWIHLFEELNEKSLIERRTSDELQLIL